MRRSAVLIAALGFVVPAHAGDYRAPVTAYGAPDLEGVWTNAWLTKLERPKDFTTLVIPEAEAAAYDKTHAGRVTMTKLISQACSSWERWTAIRCSLTWRILSPPPYP